ncbi:MAG: fructose-bisphosphatase class III [Faecalibacterium sp.]|nr:fructose-bisphosphatase class III [Ruminococcus sp.]MCM1391244.1 fructose-bisphosphatase class III [Ruminococcus sp.]MCM1484782.1 fructose-bisphosphatase class III [Faecalibacterium sp.]
MEIIMVYVTSDLHGYPLEKFLGLLSKVNFSNDDFLYVLGDVIDRGDDGIRIIKWLMAQPNVQLILGNHEAMFLACDFLFEEITEDSISRLTGSNLDVYMTWISNGGQKTIDALSAMRSSEIKYILEFLREAPLYDVLTVNNRDFLLTHSGLGNFKVGKKLRQYAPDELLWTRPQIDDRYFDDIITVFGHTPTVYYGEEHKSKALRTPTWIDIDTGAAMGGSPMLLRLDDMKEFYVE